MFTSVEFDEELFHRAQALSGTKTKKAFLDEALRVYVRLHEQAEVRSLRGKLVWNEPEGKRGADPR
jgi:Arc/MetJ family transcription regulator